MAAGVDLALACVEARLHKEKMKRLEAESGSAKETSEEKNHGMEKMKRPTEGDLLGPAKKHGNCFIIFSFSCWKPKIKVNPKNLAEPGRIEAATEAAGEEEELPS